ncbi:MAG: hypothetical protein U0U67_10100 [Chitinophagales bacterium]
MKNKFIIFSFISLLLQPALVFADSLTVSQKGKEAQESYQNEQLKQEELNKTKWNELRKDLKIDEPLPKPKEEKKEVKKKESKGINVPKKWIPFIKWSAFGIIIALLLFIVLKILGINPFIKTNDRNKIVIDIENIEENLDLADIDPFLYEAIKSKNYKLVIRLYYLMIIQKLALKEKIVWKKSKTNRNYLKEMQTKKGFEKFKMLTIAYERTWFGADEITENIYNEIQPEFVNYLQNIQKNE